MVKQERTFFFLVFLKENVLETVLAQNPVKDKSGPTTKPGPTTKQVVFQKGEGTLKCNK